MGLVTAARCGSVAAFGPGAVMKSSFVRVLCGFLAGWVLPPAMIAVIVAVLFNSGTPDPNSLADSVLKMLFYAAVIGLPFNLGVMVLLVSPTWAVLHRLKARARTFLLCGAVIGGLVGLVPLIGPASANNLPPSGELALTLIIPMVVGALSFLLIRRIAYGKAG